MDYYPRPEGVAWSNPSFHRDAILSTQRFPLLATLYFRALAKYYGINTQARDQRRRDKKRARYTHKTRCYSTVLTRTHRRLVFCVFICWGLLNVLQRGALG